MKILFEYKCPVHGKFEAMSGTNKEEKQCPDCGRFCSSIISPVKSQLDGTDPAFPTEWDRWAKKREEKAKQANKEAAREGKYADGA